MAKQLGPEQVALFCENMGMMYQAGIQTNEAVSLIAQDSGHGDLQEALAAVTKQMDEQGATLPMALKDCGAFPDHAVKMIEIAEMAGRLEPTMFALGNYYLGRKHFQDRMRTALLYPLILLALMAIVMLVLAVQVLPIFSNVYASMSGQVSERSLAYMQASQIFSYVAVAVILIATVVFFVGACIVYFGKQTTTVSKVFDAVPFTKGVSYSSSLARCLTALSTFTASGIPVEEALTSVITEIGNKKLRTKLEACIEQVAQGNGFAQAAFDQELLDPLYGRMLVNSERSGTFDNTLAYLAEIVSDDADQKSDALVTSIEPMCAAFLTIAVALSLVAMVVPLVGILGAMG